MDNRGVRKVRTFDYELLISNYPLERNGEYSLSDLVELSHEVPEKILLVKDFITQAGSSIEKADHHDVDLIVRMDPSYDYLRRAIKQNLLKKLDDQEQYHFVFEPMGPHGSHKVLYHLALVRAEGDGTFEMSDSFHRPMKPGAKFYDIDDLVRWIL